ncbi:efflux RND transporter periplasmic adaptor subunit [Cognatishimia activa]|uniref:Solvent efflux pump periplasmic linker SrpA n=1 Tax=Cognatishimia activa TaxID=1715691 RepID=A0A0P1IY94_9RHOB|nr:efflux RND transporter periplasmic adaptor subunit [Cognatishimia activa]CUI79802.1 Solvent efflux pump periplasmic linker SrpA precursor [Cognatishimia activa]CUK26855.1 Solvent efflux pump periplasmic linker SrpA precursor [Cognatishimia activa]
MRIVPILIAVIVSAFMYFFIIERDALLAFAATDDPANEDAVAQVAEASETDEAVPSNIVRVVAVHSEARVIDSAVVVRGETQAERQVDVLAETSGTIISTPLRKGAFVEANQIICEIDPGTRHATLAEAEARLIEAKAGVPAAKARVDEAVARLEEAKINDNAASKLSKDGFASETRVAATQAAVRAAEASVAAATSGLDSAQAAIQAAEAGVASAQKEIDRLTVKAPFAGLLESDTAEFGSLLQAGGPSGTHCATIIQLDPIKIVGFVPETQVNRVALGARGGARLISGDEVGGQVTFISRSADPQTRTFRIELEVPNPDLMIRDGQTAEIVIAAEGKEAHFLPQSVLTLNDEGTLGVRVVTTDNEADFVPVSVLRDTTEGIWLAGLPTKSDVIVVGQEFVTSGVPVMPTFQESDQ